MGDPKFSRSKTQTPTHPWRQARIDEEHALKEKYGLKKTGGMREIWRERTSLRRYRNQAMKLIGRVDTSEGHFAKEKEQLISSLTRKGLLPEGASVGDVLQIDIDQMLIWFYLLLLKLMVPKIFPHKDKHLLIYLFLPNL